MLSSSSAKIHNHTSPACPPRDLHTGDRPGNCETRELDTNVASLEHTIPDEHFGTLDEATTPHLDFPADLIKTITTDFVQAGATINAVESRQFSRGY